MNKLKKKSNKSKKHKYIANKKLYNEFTLDFFYLQNLQNYIFYISFFSRFTKIIF